MASWQEGFGLSSASFSVIHGVEKGTTPLCSGLHFITQAKVKKTIFQGIKPLKPVFCFFLALS